MLVTGVIFAQIVLAVHIIAVVLAFGIVVAWPLLAQTVERYDRRFMPVLHRVRVMMGRSLVNPGLLLVVVAGIYLASDLHQWKHFYVQWGIAAAIVLGGLEGSFVMRHSKKLAALSARDVETSGPGGEVKWSDEYVSLRGRSDLWSFAMAVIVLVTIYVMVVQ